MANSRCWVDVFLENLDANAGSAARATSGAYWVIAKADLVIGRVVVVTHY